VQIYGVSLLGQGQGRLFGDFDGCAGEENDFIWPCRFSPGKIAS
jgi:hypothetical protein